MLIASYNGKIGDAPISYSTYDNTHTFMHALSPNLNPEQQETICSIFPRRYPHNTEQRARVILEHFRELTQINPLKPLVAFVATSSILDHCRYTETLRQMTRHQACGNMKVMESSAVAGIFNDIVMVSANGAAIGPVTPEICAVYVVEQIGYSDLTQLVTCLSEAVFGNQGGRTAVLDFVNSYW